MRATKAKHDYQTLLGALKFHWPRRSVVTTLGLSAAPLPFFSDRIVGNKQISFSGEPRVLSLRPNLQTIDCSHQERQRGWYFGLDLLSMAVALACSLAAMGQARAQNTGVAQPPSQARQFGLTVTLTGTGNVGLSSGNGSTPCSATCTKSFNGGASVTLVASAAAGHTFAGWGGACSGAAKCVVVMSDAKSVSATFNAMQSSGPLLKWQAPATMANGTALANLTGFKVYGSKTAYDQAPTLLVTINNPTAVSAAVPGLTSGTWYFWVSATTFNAESELQYHSSAAIP